MSNEITNKRNLAFGNLSPDLYRRSEIYDPDDNTTGKFIPGVQSLVVEDVDVSLLGKLYRVASIDAITFKAELIPVRIEQATGEVAPQVLTYGNSNFALFYDNRSGRTKLNIDGTLLLAGNELRWFRLISATTGTIVSRATENSDTVYFADLLALESALVNATNAEHIKASVIAINTYGWDATNIDAFNSPESGSTYSQDNWYYVDESNSTSTSSDDTVPADASGSVKVNYYVYDGNANPPKWRRVVTLTGAVPLTEVYSVTENSTNYTLKKCLNCYALNNWKPTRGERYILEVYDTRNLLALTVNLSAVPSAQITSITVPATSFKVDCCGISNTNVWEIPFGKAKEDISFSPYLIDANGGRTNLTLSTSGECKYYGFDAVDTTNAGASYRLLFKYFAPKTASVISGLPHSFMSFEAYMNIGTGIKTRVRRYAYIPYLINYNYNSTTQLFSNVRWGLNIVGYYEAVKAPYVTLTNCAYTDNNTAFKYIFNNNVSFVGTNLGVVQSISVSINGIAHVEACNLLVAAPTASLADVQTNLTNATPTHILQYTNELLTFGTSDNNLVMPKMFYSTKNGINCYWFDVKAIQDIASALVNNNGGSYEDAFKQQVLTNYLYSAASTVIDPVNEVPTCFTLRSTRMIPIGMACLDGNNASCVYTHKAVDPLNSYRVDSDSSHEDGVVLTSFIQLKDFHRKLTLTTPVTGNYDSSLYNGGNIVNPVYGVFNTPTSSYPAYVIVVEFWKGDPTTDTDNAAKMLPLFSVPVIVYYSPELDFSNTLSD